MKKFLAMLLAIVMLLSFAACGDKETPTTAAPGTTAGPNGTTGNNGGETTTEDNGGEELSPYDAKSQELYDKVLGEFYTAYQAAKAATTLSERYALMAVAEAKLLASGVMLPSTSQGGNYAISRVAPNTATSALWGNDSYRYHNVVVATEPLTSEHRAEMKAAWAEKKGTGTYEAWAKEYLTGKGYTLKNTYELGYSTNPTTWDVLATSQAGDSEAIVNTYDGLYEYDCENVLKPALATAYTKGTTVIDGETYTTYTFTIRSGAKWVDSQGREVADVKADDFVAGMQHMMDAAGGLEYLVEGLILNAAEYIDGDVTDFAEVGVKAVDDTTLVYTLVTDAPYFMTMLGYGVFAPMSRSYYESQGGKFGAEFASDAEDYNYGKTPNNIAYCGPYLVTNATDNATIVFDANAKYWNATNVNMTKITWLFNDGEEALKAYNDMKAGTIDGCGLNANALEQAKTDGIFDTHSYISATDATSYCSFYNINRAIFANESDANACVSSQTPEQAARTNKAMLNQNFRLALSFALDRGAYNAQSVGEELKLTSLRNSYTPGTFVYLEEETTIKINGVDTTYPANTYYGKIMQDQLDADQVKIKVWDATADGGIGSGDGFDGWFSVENAQAALAAAISELAAEGLEISETNPIYIDLPYFSGSSVYTARANVYKQCFQTAFGNKVVLNLVECSSQADWLYAGYYTSSGAEANYDIYDLSGWGPDYGDPQTYLDTFLPMYAGYMTKCIGIF